jgi:hypothetical protein
MTDDDHDSIRANRLAASTGLDLLRSYLDVSLTCVKETGCAVCARDAKVYHRAIEIRDSRQGVHNT